MSFLSFIILYSLHAVQIEKVKGDFQAGYMYFCSANASTSTPTDGVTGDQCAAGHYCLTGSIAPVPCADGKFLQFYPFSYADKFVADDFKNILTSVLKSSINDRTITEKS